MSLVEEAFTVEGVEGVEGVEEVKGLTFWDLFTVLGTVMATKFNILGFKPQDIEHNGWKQITK